MTLRLTQTYVNSKIGMEQRLELPLFLARISYGKTRLQVLLVQRNGIRNTEVISFPFGRDVVKHGIREPKVELY